ncbi:MAG: mandelate racemase/muconate lactonizing enzyme family protein [Pseudomonadota bacterium]
MNAPALHLAARPRLAQITLWQVPLTSHEAYYMAEGKACETVTTSVIRLRTDTGLDGWGEVCPIPHYLPAYAGGVAPVLEDLAPVLLGADALGPEALLARADAHLVDHRYAKSALDIALFDLLGKAAGLPLSALLGGRQTETMPLYHSLTCVAPDEMARMARDAQATGITQFQVKLGADDDPQMDIERLRKVREAVGPGPLVYGDWNCGTTALKAIRVGRAVADADVMLEQPCATIDDCARVARATGLPMKQDETAHDTATLLAAHGSGCMDAVALKLSKFGGLARTRAARDLCVTLGVEMCVECTWGSDIVTAAALHLAASTPPSRLLNTCDLSGYVGPRLAPDCPVRAGGRIAPPEGPGLGITPDAGVLGTPILELG